MQIPKIVKNVQCLMVAVRYSGSSIVKILLEYGADANVQDCFSFSALMSTVQRGNNNVIKLLLNYGVSVNAVDKYGWSARFDIGGVYVSNLKLRKEDECHQFSTLYRNLVMAGKIKRN